ncbi:MAG: myo-inositol-1(or 4)-monophosphatase [Myxococcota bacterium]
MTELDVAIEAARAAGAILQAAGGAVEVRHKGAVDLVTEVDEAAEAAVRAVLSRHTPDIPVLGEEGGGPWDVGTRWIVDPLDGTTNFVHGFPWYCTSIGLEVDGVRQVGVIYAPVLDRLYAAERGGGATCDGAPIRVSACADLGGALVATGFPYDRRTRAARYLRDVERALTRVQGLRRAGAAALDLALVATGQLDAYWEHRIRPWDLAAGALLVEEAGGRVTGHDGGPLDAEWPCPLASNGLLHASLQEMLAD